MKKFLSISIILLFITSCNNIKVGNDINLSSTGIKVGEIELSTGEINVGNDITINSTGIKVDDIEVNSGEEEEKDSVIVKDENGTGDIQQEVIGEIENEANDLFNMIDQDVK